MNWNLLSKYRIELMGIATIGVVIFHFCEMVLNHIKEASYFANIIGQSFFRHGYIGVEMFLLLSGMGCYYSFCKKIDIRKFYKKRLIKIIIPYLIIAIPFWSYKNLYLEFNLESFVYNITGLSLFTEGVRTFWYVFLILIMYFIFPVLFYFFSKDNIIRHVAFGVIEIMVILMTYLLHVQYPNLYKLIEILLTRIPIFVYGAYIGKNVYEKKSVSWFILIGFIIMLFVDFDLENDLLKRYVNSMQAIGFSLIIVKIFDIINIYQINVNSLRKMLSLIGTCSFEIYLIHIAYREIFNIASISTYDIKIYVVIICLTIITSIIIKRLVSKINANIFKIKEA